jgi:HrpA-like RNA helicase
VQYPDLPFSEKREEFLQKVAESRRFVVCAMMGGGKTTLVAPWLVECGAGRVLVVVPRRLLAMRAAERVAPIMNSLVGERVGYIIRAGHHAHGRTEITFVTEGIFKRLLQHNLLLPGFGAVAFDEAHEQGAWSIVFQGLIKSLLLPQRPAFIPGVMSGTLDEALYTSYWDAPLVSSTARGYPLDIRYEPHMTVRQAVASILSGKATPATILVFQPGYAELRECAAELRKAFPRAEVLELYGTQEPDEQRRVLVPPRGWRFIVATNIAESGLTLDGVRYIVDTGTEQLPIFDQDLGVERLETVDISQRSADQRANRAGRLPPGSGRRRATRDVPSSASRKSSAATSPRRSCGCARSGLRCAIWICSTRPPRTISAQGRRRCAGWAQSRTTLSRTSATPCWPCPSMTCGWRRPWCWPAPPLMGAPSKTC